MEAVRFGIFSIVSSNRLKKLLCTRVSNNNFWILDVITETIKIQLTDQS